MREISNIFFFYFYSLSWLNDLRGLRLPLLLLVITVNIFSIELRHCLSLDIHFDSLIVDLSLLFVLHFFGLLEIPIGLVDLTNNVD